LGYGSIDPHPVHSRETPRVTGIVEFLLATPLLLVPILILAAMIVFAILKKLLKIAAVLVIAGALYVLLVQYLGRG
jgi:hypothetical protein